MMNEMTLKKLAREKRGEVTAEFLRQYEAHTDQGLIKLLNDSNPQVRASAAKFLGERRSTVAIPNLCSQFSHEKALYAKIAISNALSSMGGPAIPELLKYIGKIGQNQHQDLPVDIFKKWNYPCPRDITIRSISRIGEPALEKLNEFLSVCNDETLICEVIDAIGHISFYTQDQSSFNNLMRILAKYPGNKVLTWKLIRALQAFPNHQTIEVLHHFLFESGIPQYRWEAARSLGQIATEKAAEYLKMAREDHHAQVRAMVEISLEHLKTKGTKLINKEIV
jgi:HEAT repeat protein